MEPIDAGRSDRRHTSQLAATDDRPNGAAGTIYGQIVLRNASTTQPCTLYGYVGLQLLDASRQMMATFVSRDQTRPPVLLTLDSQQQA
jgi:hypothetical protein